MWAKHSSPIMIRRAKRAAIFASPFVVVGAWTAYVLKERRKPPADVRFAIGSAGVCPPRLWVLLLAALHPQKHKSKLTQLTSSLWPREPAISCFHGCCKSRSSDQNN